jgi:hypothetical protein
MLIKLVKYNVSSYWFREAVGAWIDYDEDQRTIIETYDYLDLCFDMHNVTVACNKGGTE